MSTAPTNGTDPRVDMIAEAVRPTAWPALNDVERDDLRAYSRRLLRSLDALADQAPSDGFDVPAFVVMSERKTELAYKGVHTREAAESLAGGFDDVEVRGAEDVIRELCEQVAAMAPPVPREKWCTCDVGAPNIRCAEHGDLLAAAPSTPGGGGPVGAVRVHPDDDPSDPAARRYLLTDDGVYASWVRITGREKESLRSYHVVTNADEYETSGPRQSLAELARVLGHETTLGQTAASGEPYLHTLRCVKDACTEDCPRRHEGEPAPDLRAALVEALLSHPELANGWSDRAVGYTRPQDDGGPSIIDLLVAAIGKVRPAVETLTAAEVRALPAGSWFVPVDDRGVPLCDTDGPARAHPSDHFYRAKNTPTPDRHAVVYRAPEPEPVAPLAVGDTLTTPSDLNRLPVGAIVRDEVGVAAQRYPDGWTFTDGSRVLQWVALPARVLDLPASVGSS